MLRASGIIVDAELFGNGFMASACHLKLSVYKSLKLM